MFDRYAAVLLALMTRVSSCLTGYEACRRLWERYKIYSQWQPSWPRTLAVVGVCVCSTAQQV